LVIIEFYRFLECTFTNQNKNKCRCTKGRLIILDFNLRWGGGYKSFTIIAWSCAMNHILEVGGALAPGSCPTLSPTHFTDGFTYPLLKIGENFNTFRWFDLMWERQTRQPQFNIIDSKMRVTGAKLIHDKVLEIVEEFGVDYFRKAMREILERERRRVLGVLKERTVPGIYQEIALNYSGFYKGRMSQLFPESDRDWLLTYCAEIQIQSDASLSIDFEGTNSQDYFEQNGYPGGGSSWALLVVDTNGCIWRYSQHGYRLCPDAEGTCRLTIQS
jgi:N-methylhydantoinase B/acetone carboxylase alpha subunit